MTDEVFVYVTDLPRKINEMVCPCLDGYCVYLNARLSQSQQEKAYRHAMRHIENHDFESEESISEIEIRAHEGTK